MLKEIERVEGLQSELYKEVDRKIGQLVEKYPSMMSDLLDLESLFLDINIKSNADMYIAGYEKGRLMMAEDMQSSTQTIQGKPKFMPTFRRNKGLRQAK